MRSMMGTATLSSWKNSPQSGEVFVGGQDDRAIWEPGGQVREALVFDGRSLGILVGTAEGIRWTIASSEGSFSLDALERRVIEDVFSTLRGELEAAAQQTS